VSFPNIQTATFPKNLSANTELQFSPTVW